MAEGNRRSYNPLESFILDHSEHLLRSWLRAKEDGNDETLGNYLLGEYDCYRKNGGDGYEYPYQAMCDRASKAETLVFPEQRKTARK